MPNPVDEVAILALIKDYSAQLSLDPASDVFIPLAQCYAKLSLLDSAINVVRQGLLHCQDHLGAQVLLADLLCQHKQYDDSAALYENVLQLDANFVPALCGIAQLSIVQTHWQRAKEYVEKIRGIDAENEMLSQLESQLNTIHDDVAEVNTAKLVTATMAELYLQQGLKEQAISAYKILVKQQPENDILRCRLHELLAIENNKDDLLRDDLVLSPPLAQLECWLEAIERRRKDV